MRRGPNGTLFSLPLSTMHCVKLGIPGEAAPLQCRVSTPHHSNFQPINLGGSFSKATCRPHNRSLQSTRTTAPTPPTFETGSLACKREPRLPFPTVAFQLYDSALQTDNGRK
ncbi:hypothetical protein AVEN_34829-1 [Araneus ventricosus]|uniref:Uncharacterized protein n=1 Tax=Araneus ventricosus TaxID=182803 RepID=A0A4Y2W0M7_ARAVE|nr:hypothetical protein AVEN_178982-1 [Araneus ventricosus]GBO30106.1 hypothetical protein AVEN_208290-1 [Araneus ventricosus]GBO42029.1 hypothetical protein AVEN_34829-1 [Araneus ventricosus]